MTLTNQNAAEYVTKIENSWGQRGIIVSIHESEVSTLDHPALDVHTADNHWTVWIEMGAIYGES